MIEIVPWRFDMRNWAILGAVVLVSGTALGQVPPFTGGGVTAYDPEPATIFSGALMDAQAVVSHDRKYVTLNMRATNTRLRELVRFPVVDTQALGFVGGGDLPGGPAVAPRPTAAPAQGTGGARAANAAPSAAPASATPSPDQIARNAKAWVFTRQGVYLLQPLE
jgi:hypothetical protein